MFSPGGLGGSSSGRRSGGGRSQPQPSPRVDPDQSQRSAVESNASASERSSFPSSTGILRLARRRPSMAHGRWGNCRARQMCVVLGKLLLLFSSFLLVVQQLVCSRVQGVAVTRQSSRQYRAWGRERKRVSGR